MRFEKRQELKHSLEQRLELLLQVRLELIHELRGNTYKPEGDCPSCGRAMKSTEIISGFLDDPHDFTTKCTNKKCNKRFEPKLVFKNEHGSTVRIPFFCSLQTIEQLRSAVALNPEEIALQFPGVYHSAILHHGTLKNAFSKIGIVYTKEVIDSWQVKVRMFLGRLPDTEIAECVGVKPIVISKMRRNLGVPRFIKGR